jgi:AAA domain
LSNVFSDFGRSDQPVPHDLLKIPISFFESVKDNGSKGFYADINHTVTWRELRDVLVHLAVTPYKSKADAPLFSPTVFEGTRCVENATVSAAVVIDADKGFDIHSAERFLTEKEIEAILYTTASNTDGTRFRIVVPLLSAVDPETHKEVVKAVCAFIKPGWKPDTSKSNCYSLFYVPGRYAGAKNEFIHIEGTIFPAEAWLQLGGQALAEDGKTAVALSNGHDAVLSEMKTRSTPTTWNSSIDYPYVDQEWVRDYLGLTDDFYNELFGFMCRVALSALRQGIELAPAQLAELARDVEGLSGRSHKSWDVQTRDLEGEADNALDFARREIARTPASPNLPGIESCGTAMSFLDWMMSEETGRLRPVAKPVADQSANPIVEWDAGLDDAVIEPRQWLLGNKFCRRYVSTIVADGGTGKTALRIAEAIALATGRPITGEHVFQRSRVLFVSLEDDADEIRRRIKACCLHHKIGSDELRDHLFVAALANGPKLATMAKGGAITPGGLGQEIAQIIERRQIDLVILDPFIKSHGCDENDNNAIDRVTGILAELAIRFNVAIDAPHHVSKGMVDPGNANRGRGASAFKDAARLVYTLSRMTQDEAKELGIDEADRWRYIRVDSGKVNIAPAAATASWFRLVGVPLGNTSLTYPSGDEVQTVEPWTPVDPMTLVDDDGLRDAILTEIKNAPPNALYTAHAQSKGRHILEVFKRHLPEITKKQSQKIIEAWKIEGLVEEVDFTDNTRHKRKGLQLCE